MPATIKSSWPQFQDAAYIEWALLLDGYPLGSPVQLPGTAIEQEFYAEFAPPTDRYAVNVRPVGHTISATLSIVGGGGNGGGSEGGGGGP